MIKPIFKSNIKTSLFLLLSIIIFGLAVVVSSYLDYNVLKNIFLILMNVVLLIILMRFIFYFTQLICFLFYLIRRKKDANLGKDKRKV